MLPPRNFYNRKTLFFLEIVGKRNYDVFSDLQVFEKVVHL